MSDGPVFTEEGARHRIETLLEEREGMNAENARLAAKIAELEDATIPALTVRQARMEKELATERARVAELEAERDMLTAYAKTQSMLTSGWAESAAALVVERDQALARVQVSEERADHYVKAHDSVCIELSGKHKELAAERATSARLREMLRELTTSPLTPEESKWAAEAVARWANTPAPAVVPKVAGKEKLIADVNAILAPFGGFVDRQKMRDFGLEPKVDDPADPTPEGGAE